jgi:hypothetical protein
VIVERFLELVLELAIEDAVDVAGAMNYCDRPVAANLL